MKLKMEIAINKPCSTPLKKMNKTYHLQHLIALYWVHRALLAHYLKGAEASVVLYSIVMTCRTSDINPYFCFKKLFEISPNRMNSDDLSDLLQWHEQFKA